ncbi:hypothetical protein D3C86_1703830 [compost metagenome]
MNYRAEWLENIIVVLEPTITVSFPVSIHGNPMSWDFDTMGLGDIVIDVPNKIVVGFEVIVMTRSCSRIQSEVDDIVVLDR